MALYVSAAARRRKAIAVAVVVGILAFGVGLLIGRQQVPSIDSRVQSVQSQAGDIATGIERLDIEYRKVLAGGDSMDLAVLRPLTELVTRAQHAMNDAPWITATQRNALLDALTQLHQSAAATDPLATFEQKLASSAGVVRSTFGVKA
ncbi:MAG: hypothetical protein ABIQ39_13600 [Ilumatobacteraceae bacterium]